MLEIVSHSPYFNSISVWSQSAYSGSFNTYIIFGTIEAPELLIYKRVYVTGVEEAERPELSPFL